MNAPIDFPQPDLDHARSQLREGIENSLVLVRQSRVLIELTEADCPWPGDDEIGPAN